jgi:hypothetical protein
VPDVANGLILAEKSPKNPFLVKLPKFGKIGKTPPKKIFFLPNQVGFSRI